jgi:hypothetical protein
MKAPGLDDIFDCASQKVAHKETSMQRGNGLQNQRVVIIAARLASRTNL